MEDRSDDRWDSGRGACIQATSTLSFAAAPSTVAKLVSGYCNRMSCHMRPGQYLESQSGEPKAVATNRRACVEEWLPQITTFFTAAGDTPALIASCP